MIGTRGVDEHDVTHTISVLSSVELYTLNCLLLLLGQHVTNNVGLALFTISDLYLNAVVLKSMRN